MTKEYRNISKGNAGNFNKHIRDILDPKNTLPFTVSNYFDIMNNIADSNKDYCVRYVFLVSKAWMHAFCGSRIFGEKKVSKNFSIMYTYDEKKLKSIVKSSSLVIYRGNYNQWNGLVDNINCKYIFLPCWSKIRPDNTKFSILKESTTVLVDDPAIRSLFLESGYKSQIFQKPAMNLFYEDSNFCKKDIDISFICSNTDRKHKRADLFINGMIELDKIVQKKRNICLVGDSSAHNDRIKSINLSKIKIEQAYGGKRTSRANIAKTLDRSKLSICTSDFDANPRVIVESLAKNIPVLCASDLAGGKFQINKKTGAFFEPNPKSLAAIAKDCLNNLNKFSPKKHSIKIDDAVNQILQILNSL